MTGRQTQAEIFGVGTDYMITFDYEGERERTTRVKGMKDLKEFIAEGDKMGRRIIQIYNLDSGKDLTKRYVRR